MIFHLSVFFAALLFSGGLAIIGAQAQFVIWAVLVLLALSIRHSFAFGRNLPMPANIPIVFSLSSSLLLSFIDLPIERAVFVVVAGLAYYILLLGLYRLSRNPGDLSARAMIAMTVMITLFFYYGMTYGFYLNFDIPLWMFMIAYGFGTYLVAYQALLLIGGDKKSVSVYSLIIALALTEIAWVLNFWPFSYLTSGVVTLMFFYALFDLSQSHFLGMLSKQRSVVHLSMFFVLMVMVLMSSRWLPVG